MYLLLLLAVIINGVMLDHVCDGPIILPTSSSAHQVESAYSRSKRGTQNLRISRYYDSSYTSLPNQADITSMVLDPAVQFWQNSLWVNNPLTSPLLVDKECSDSYRFLTVGSKRLKVCTSSCVQTQMCYTTAIPSQYIQQCYTSDGKGGYVASGTAGPGAANTDLLLIITQKPDGCTASVLAYAMTCVLEDMQDRPVIGLVNICPGNINLGVGLRMSQATVKHEIAHILGVSSSLYAFYRNQSGIPLTPRDANGVPNLGFKYIQNSRVYQYSDITVKDYNKNFNYIVGPQTKTVSYIVTPTVKTEMQNYFNCSTLEGMMLEDAGTAANVLSHFKKQYLQTELMTASISVVSQASRLTLAVLQDTGWYTANFGNADAFTFAQNLGCKFVTSSCYDYINSMSAASASLGPYCNVPVSSGGLSCTADMKMQTFCNLYDSSSISPTVPAQFKYFSNPNWVSTDPFSDYCPFTTVYALAVSEVIVHTGDCTDPQNAALSGSQYDYFNQGFGTNAVCINFPKTPLWYFERCGSSLMPTMQGVGCYQYQCLQSYGLVIVVNRILYQCKEANQIIDVTSKNTYMIPHGKLVCPSCSAVCSNSICNSVTSTMAVQCNNVDRLCPEFTGYSVPCLTPTTRSSNGAQLKFEHSRITVWIFLLISLSMFMD